MVRQNPIVLAGLFSAALSREGVNALCTAPKLLSTIQRAQGTTSRRIKAAPFTVDDLPQETMYIIDGTALLYNAYYSREHRNDFSDAEFTEAFAKSNELLELLSDMSLSDLNASSTETESVNSTNLRCGTLTAMSMIFARFIRDIQPRFVAVAFDTGRPSFRADLYPDYKAGRKKKPADLVPLFGIAPRILSLLGARCFQLSKFEADDIMASLSKWSRGRGLNVVHVSVDKDMLQLVTSGVHVMHLKNKSIFGVDEIQEKYGVHPSSLTELHALTGDSADNIQGVPGIGPKTASMLLGHFGNIKTLYEQVGLSSGTSDHDPPLVPEEVGMSTLKFLSRYKSVYKYLSKVPYRKVVFMKELLTLHEDLPLTDLEIFHEQHNTWSPLSSVVGGSGVEKDESAINTYFFRYRGERSPGAAECLKDVSQSLEKPLQLLRQQYGKLDRV